MPRFSPAGFTRLTTHVPAGTTDYTFAPSDSIAALAGAPPAGGILFHLPGPRTKPDDLPNDGDQYAVSDADAFASSGHAIFVDGGGYLLFGSTTTPLGPCTFGAEALLVFTFDAKNGAWAISEQF